MNSSATVDKIFHQGLYLGFVRWLFQNTILIVRSLGGGGIGSNSQDILREYMSQSALDT